MNGVLKAKTTETRTKEDNLPVNERRWMSKDTYGSWICSKLHLTIHTQIAARAFHQTRWASASFWCLAMIIMSHAFVFAQNTMMIIEQTEIEYKQVIWTSVRLWVRVGKDTAKHEDLASVQCAWVVWTNRQMTRFNLKEKDVKMKGFKCPQRQYTLMADHSLDLQSNTWTSLKNRLFFAPPTIYSWLDSWDECNIVVNNSRTHG